jgi:hypothetical protein
MTDSYGHEDVQLILQRAIVQQAKAGDLTRQQLVEIASELGISASQLQQAEQEWFTLKQEMPEREAFQHYRRSRFRGHLTKYLIVNAFLVGLDLLTTQGLTWSLYLLLGWGLGLALDGTNAYQRQGEKFEREFRQWQQRQQFKQFRHEVGQTVSHLLRKGLRELQR